MPQLTKNMPLTQANLVQMDENQLRTGVLIPLFEAMGFKGVHLYHGGSLELGKDILMWKPEGVSERVNYVVVAKAQPIRGRVSGKDSFSDVVRQIHQCFGNNYLDPTTLRDIKAERCIVVTSKECPKEAQNAIRGELKNTHLDKVTQFIDGNELWRHVERHLGNRTVWAKLNEVKKLFDQTSPHYRVVVNTAGNQNIVTLEPKHPDAAKEHPVKFAAKFDFSPDQEGTAAKAALEQHLKTGTPAAISGKFIKDFQWPEVLKPFMEPDHRIAEIRLGPKRSRHRFLVSMQAKGATGETVVLSNIDLLNERSGTEKLVFSNEKQRVPWHLEIVLSRENGSGIFSFNTDYSGFNVHQELEGLRFERVLAHGAKVEIINQETGLHPV